MCFSAAASFGAGAILCTAGAFTLSKVRKPSQLAFAAIPFFFGIQQLSEGFVWISLTHVEYAKWKDAAVHVFSFFSHVLWPVWVPFSVLLFEQDSKKKRFLFPIFMVALLLSLTEVYFISVQGVQARIDGHHVEYYIAFPSLFISISEIVYGLVTIVPCFISSYKNMKWFAIVLIVSIVAADYFYHRWMISVWCFFAALLSTIIYWIIKQLPVTGQRTA